mgnify:CR=1 FL=1
MSIPTVYVGDIGAILRLTSSVDLSAATSAAIKYRKPSGATGEWSATIYDSTGVQYVVQDGDLDESGQWTLQGYVTMPGWSGHSKAVRVTVGRTIDVS